MTDELLQLVNTKEDIYEDWKKNSKTLNIYNEQKGHFRAFDKIKLPKEPKKNTYKQSIS